MATLSAAMVTLLTDNWAGAGAAPTFGALIDYQKDLADTTEQVIVRLPIHEDVDPINDIYSNFKFTMQLRVKSTVSEDRLKVLTDETIRILNTYAITGITRQFAKRGENTSDSRRKIYSYDVWAILEEHMSTGGTAYASPGAGDVVFPADVTVTDDLITDNIISANPINIKPSGDIDDYLEIDTIGNHMFIKVIGGGLLHIRGDAGFRFQPSGDNTDYIEFSTTGNIPKIASKGASDLQLATDTQTIGVDQIADLLMFGSANAAWVNCPCEPAYSTTWIYNLSGWITNTGVNNPTIVFSLPLATNRGGLKLYISGVRVGIGDADAQAYVENTLVYGFNGNTRTQLDLNTTDLNSAGEHEDTFAAVDCSGETAVKVILGCDVDAANELDIGYVAVRCYYAA